MKSRLIPSIVFITLLFFGCNGSDPKTAPDSSAPQSSTAKSEDLYFDFTIDGTPIHIDAADISTSYNEVSPTDIVFKVYAGKDEGTQLSLTIPQDMSKPSSTPSGSPEPGNKIFQGSVSLQGYPQKQYTFNNYDGFMNPKPESVPNAIVVTSSERIGDEARVISGTIDTVVLSGDASNTDPEMKNRKIVGKFRIKHVFSGSKF